jgi:hypothetical protein
MKSIKSPGAVAALGASKNDPLGGKVFSKTKRQKRFAEAPSALFGSHPRQQLELFTAPAPADALTGLAVRLPHDPCRCGADLVEIGPGNGPHSAALECLVCGGHRGWLSHTTHKFLTEIVNNFGRPETPIVIQRGTSFAASAAKTHGESPPTTCASTGGKTED